LLLLLSGAADAAQVTPDQGLMAATTLPLDEGHIIPVYEGCGPYGHRGPWGAAVREVSGAVMAGTPALRAATLALGAALLAKFLAALGRLSYRYGRLTGFIRRSSVIQDCAWPQPAIFCSCELCARPGCEPERSRLAGAGSVRFCFAHFR
jgi:hypothetical protein